MSEVIKVLHSSLKMTIVVQFICITVIYCITIIDYFMYCLYYITFNQTISYNY